jgi:hypothetical protein
MKNRILLLALLLFPVGLLAQIPSFTVASVSGLANHTINVSVSLTAGTSPCFSTQFDLVLPAGITFASKVAGPALATAGYTLHPAGGVRSLLMDGSGGITPMSPGVLVIYTLNVDPTVLTGTYAISLTGLVVSNSAGSQAVVCSIVGGNIGVTGLPFKPTKFRIV